jgi:hypothetical protein
MRIVLTAGFLFATLLGSGCSSMRYSDNYEAVRANPECATQSPQPGEPTAPWCEPKQEATFWSSESKGEPVDFGKDDDER